MNRLMDVKETPESIEIETTDIQLPQRVGKARHRDYNGELASQYDQDAYSMRMSPFICCGRKS